MGPRHGSMQFWPRVKAQRHYARIRSWPTITETKPLGFGGYKVGMTHIMVKDPRPNSLTKGMTISLPVTVVECPPLKVAAIRFYKYSICIGEQWAEKLDKEITRKIPVRKKQAAPFEKDFDDIMVLVYTQPRLIGIGKKKPDIFEIAVGGKNKEERLEYAKQHLGAEIKIEDIFKEGQFIDIHAVTKGKGMQGPVKRFGVPVRRHKSEKTKRGPGSLGAWCAQPHYMYRVAHAGKMGYHLRTEYNKQVILISSKPERVNPKGGFVRYGVVKNPFILIHGSIAGASKRILRLNLPIRPNKKVSTQPFEVTYIHTETHQGA